jgi:hypothetical protein
VESCTKRRKISPITRRCTKTGFLSRFFPVEFPTKMMDFDQVIHISAELSTENQALIHRFLWIE